jgi:signal peptidase I
MAEKAEKAARTDRSVFREYFEAILIASLFLRFTNVFVVQTFYIPSESMEDTLLVGDHLFVNRFIYGPAATDWERRYLPLRPIRRGDIIIFRSKTEIGMDIVKRAMGAPGDTIQVADKQLYLNGQPLDDSAYAVHKDPALFPSCDPSLRLPASACNRDQFGPVTVPAGNYFCMGDNRDKSYDSRFWGTLPGHLVKGRALFIYWSNGAQQPEGSGLAGVIRTALGFLSNTRWERSFRLIR